MFSCPYSQRLGRRLTTLQECETLKKGFTKLHEKHNRSIVKVSAVQDELNACRSESEQLKTQVTALQEELKAQNEALTARVTSAVSSAVSTAAAASRIVRIGVQHYRLTRSLTYF